jgi:hypothetical protein
MTDVTDPCAWFDEDVAELVLGVLDPVTADALTAHVAGCERCRTELDASARALDRLMDMTPEIDPPAGFAARAVLAMETEAPVTTAPDTAPVRLAARRRTTARLLAAAALVAVLVAAATLFWPTRPADGPVGSLATAALVDAGGRGHGSVVLARRSAGSTTGAVAVTLTLTDVPPSTYHCIVIDEQGRSTEIDSWKVSRRGTDVWTMQLDGVAPAAVAITGGDGGEVARATFN